MTEERQQKIMEALSGMSYRDAKQLIINILNEKLQDNCVIVCHPADDHE